MATVKKFLGGILNTLAAKKKSTRRILHAVFVQKEVPTVKWNLPP